MIDKHINCADIGSMAVGEERGSKKYIDIAERIRADIHAGKYVPGDKIPSLRRLAALYGANTQTVNKATAYLASLGYLKPRQGYGCQVCLPQAASAPKKGIAMLIDQSRTRLLQDLNEVSNYHGKDIYLSFLMEMSRRGLSSGFIVYDRSCEQIPAEFRQEAAAVSGFIVQGSLPPCYLKFLGEENIPAVFINRPCPQEIHGRFGSVLISGEQIPNLVNYLLSLGHTKLLYVLSREFEENEIFCERLKLIQNAFKDWDLRGEGVLEVFRFTPGGSDASKTLQELLAQGFSAAFGYNDGSALSFYSLIHQIGLHIPEDFSVVGFDDITASRLATPPLTTIRVNRLELVHQAFQLLDSLSSSLETAAVTRISPTELVIRKSAYARRQ